MAGTIGVLNAGSSSVKFSLFLTSGSELDLTVRGQIEGVYASPHFVAKRNDGTIASEKSWPEGTKLGHDGALDHLVAFLRSEFAGAPLVGVGHRVVHGGPNYAQPVVIDVGTVAALEKLVPLTPLHQPHNLAPIRWLFGRLPELRQVACFDTSFHRTNPELAQRFALPEELHEAGVRRYGFHGLRRRRRVELLCCTSATARACARSRPAGALRARWDSPHSTACRWALAAARSTPA